MNSASQFSSSRASLRLRCLDGDDAAINRRCNNTMEPAVWRQDEAPVTDRRTGELPHWQRLQRKDNLGSAMVLAGPSFHHRCAKLSSVIASCNDRPGEGIFSIVQRSLANADHPPHHGADANQADSGWTRTTEGNG